MKNWCQIVGMSISGVALTAAIVFTFMSKATQGSQINELVKLNKAVVQNEDAHDQAITLINTKLNQVVETENEIKEDIKFIKNNLVFSTMNNSPPSPHN